MIFRHVSTGQIFAYEDITNRSFWLSDNSCIVGTVPWDWEEAYKCKEVNLLAYNIIDRW